MTALFVFLGLSLRIKKIQIKKKKNDKTNENLDEKKLMQKFFVYFSTSRGSILRFLVRIKNFVKKEHLAKIL